jgi:photosystem II stability/assembly factor-like uncharacterized protein
MTSSRRILLAAAAAAAALPVATASAGVQTGTSGWQWGNPLPQGNQLQAMAFAGPVGYASGAFGTLLKTTDGGTTWTGLRTGTAQALDQVQVVDADTVVTGGGCVARLSTNGGQSFSRIAFTPVESSCDQPLTSLSFATKDTGFLLLADGSVLQTTDGGQTFTPRTAVPGSRAAGGGSPGGAVAFRSATAGFAATAGGTIFTTADQGQSWKQVADTGVALDRITFVTPERAFATGPGGGLARTSDGGQTWVTRPSGAPKLTGIACADASTCLLATGSATLLRTADGAQTVPTPVKASNDAFNAVGFASATRAVAGGDRGSTVISDDSGLTFAPIGGRLDGRFFSVVAGGSARTAYAPGPRGTLGRTADGGQSWQSGNIPTTADVATASFPSASEGYALDRRSGVFRTINGAASWAPLDVGTTSSITDLLAPAPGVVLVAGAGGLRRSTDRGDEFTAASGKALKAVRLTSLDAAAGRMVVAYSPTGLVRSTDRGATWSTVRKPGPYVRLKSGKLRNQTILREVDFATATTGWAITSSGGLWRTTNGGRSWSELPGVGAGVAGSSLAMTSATTGYLTLPGFGDVGRAGFLLRTTDAGTTWHPQLVAQQPIGFGGVAASAGTSYALAGDGLLSTTGGGDAGATSTVTLTTAKARVSKPGAVTVTGRLKPAQGGERVTVSFRAAGSKRWFAQTVRTGATGSFTASVGARKGVNQVVAQWAGDFRSAGDGSTPLAITVGKAKRK